MRIKRRVPKASEVEIELKIYHHHAGRLYARLAVNSARRRITLSREWHASIQNRTTRH
jgi:hypothetical protein